MTTASARQDASKRLLVVIVWSLAIGCCAVPWVAGVPRLARGLQAWKSDGAEATVDYPISQYKGSATGGWSESARSAISAGASWCAVGAIATGGLAWLYFARRRQAA